MALTKTQRIVASRMWASGSTMREITDALCVTYNEVRGAIDHHREEFPRRYSRKGDARCRCR